jgi:hypothetical protein
MMSMDCRTSISSAMAIAEGQVHGQASMRLDDFIVVVSESPCERFGAVSVVASFTAGWYVSDVTLEERSWRRKRTASH